MSARSPAEVFDALESSSRGLAAAKAASRLAALGPNELRAAKPPPVFRKVLAQFTNLFALVLLGASVITFASYPMQSPRDIGSLELAVAILAVVVLNGAIGFFQEYSAEKTSEALQAPVPHTARVRASSLQRNVSRMARQVSAVAVAPAKLALWHCDGNTFKHCDLRGQR